MKKIAGFTEYSINESGKVYSHKSRRYLKPRINKKTGYFQTCLCIKGKTHYHYIHRLVAETYLENPMNKPMVNHIDGDKGNNHLLNLEYVTAQENSQHAYRTGLLDGTACNKPVRGSAHPKSKTVVMSSESGHIEITFPSICQAAKESFIDYSTIHGALYGKFKQAGGWKWAFAN